jgi:hypothetical protein
MLAPHIATQKARSGCGSYPLIVILVEYFSALPSMFILFILFLSLLLTGFRVIDAFSLMSLE